MNPLFLRSQAESSSKPNLEKLHKLIKSENSATPKKEEEKMKKNIPNNWIYSENAAKQVWDDIEKSVKINYFDDTTIEENPFKKIDESAARIRQAITNYEIQDQDLLMELIDALDDESAVDNLDQESLLNEARAKLFQMITNHVDNSEEQKNMLDSLRFWFSDLQKGKTNDDPDFKNDKFDAKAFLDFLKKMAKDKEEYAENAMTIHTDIVSMLLNRINEIQKTLNEKEFLLSRESEKGGAISTNKAKSRGRRAMNVRGSFEVDKELTIAQRKISELQSQVTNLKQALIEYAKPTKEGEEKPSIAPLISLEKEFELDQKIAVLTDEIKSLKSNNKFLQTQIGKSKQNELVLENKLANAEKAKKAMEHNVQTMNQKMEQMESVYQEKIKAIQNETLLSKESDTSSSLAESQKYQKQIQEMNQLHQESVSTIMKENERRFRQQMKELTAAYESGDQSKILSTTVENYNNEIKKLREQCDSQIESQKKLFSNQLMELTSNYEKIILKKDKEREILKESFNSTLKATEMSTKLNFEEEERKKIFELTEKQNEELVFIRVDFTKKIDDLKRKLDRAIHERDTLRNLIETSTVATLLDELNFDDDFEEEEEEDKNEEDNVLFKSSMLIKQREIERNITDKYLNIIDNQKKILKDVFDWEIEHARIYYQTEQNNNLSSFREKTVEKIQQIYKNMTSSETTLENLLSTIIQQLSDNEQTILSPSMVPMNEVEIKMEELRTKLVDFESENHVWKKMFEKLGSDLTSFQKEEILDAIHGSIQINVGGEAQRDDEIQKEEDKNLLSRQATEIKTNATQDPSKESTEKNEIFKEEETPKKTVQRTPTRRRARLTRTMPSVIIHYASSAKPNSTPQQPSKQAMQTPKSSTPSKSNSKIEEVSTDISKKTSTFNTPSKKDQSFSQQEYIEANETEMMKKLQEAEDDAVEMRKIFIEYSLRVINLLKKNPTARHSNDKTRKIKYDTCFDISKKISDFNIAPQGTLKMSNTDILERLKDREIHPPDPDQIIDQVRSLLLQLSNVQLKFNARETASNAIITEASPTIVNANLISSNNLEIFKKFHASLKIKINDELRPMFLTIAESAKNLIEEHDLIISKLKGSYVELAKKSATENVKSKQMMEQAKSELIKEREENQKNKEAIRKNHDLIENLESKLNDSVSKLQQIAIQNEVNQRNIAAFNQIEEEGKQSIDSMTEMILKLRDIIHQQEKEIEKLRLNNQSLEATVELFITGRNCKLSREFPTTVIHYPDSDDEVQVPHLQGISNIQQQQQQHILTPSSVKSERIRCRVTNNGNNNSCRSQSTARVFVPAKRQSPITKGSKNPIPTVEVSPIYGENYEAVTNKDNDDGNSSIVVYVTPFIKEKQHQLPKGAPGLLLPANINNPNGVAANTNYYISNDGFYTVNPGKTAAVTVNNEGSSSNYLVSERLPFKESEVNSSYFRDLEIRIRSYEKQLLEMQTKLHLEKDKTHEANQALFRAGIQNQKAVREIKKQMIYKENAVKGMSKALVMVSERDKKIRLLTTKINKFNKIAASISDKIDENEKEKKIDEFSLNSDEKRRKRLNRPKYLLFDDPKVELMYEKIIKSLNNNSIFSAMAQNEMKTIARIQLLRKKAIEEEQNRIMGALDAMCFLTQPPMRPASSVKVTSTKSLTPKKPKMRKPIYVPVNPK
ncbi:hypothetical protein M9Y10_028256 [Tritrichomonas musculus]|uniref:Uncharacterized protein n=1 Tax=Tritrichomonas musculus TaxID=1915356 RepID=A0ABR2KJV6_9EUKA